MNALAGWLARGAVFPARVSDDCGRNIDRARPSPYTVSAIENRRE